MATRLTLLCLAAMAAPVAAQAADMPQIAPLDIAIANAGHDWTGAYAGVNAGGAIGDFGTFTPAGGDRFSGSGGLGGFQIGYNRQLGSVVIGVEGDVQATSIEGDTTLPAGASAETRLDWFATARGRIGYAFDRTLVYGTAGAGLGSIETEVPGVGRDDQTAWGLAAGAGVERALTENLTLKAEYLYLDLEGKESDTGIADQNSEWDGHVMRFGANLKF
jgi:outer membrane immunogenic protein